jgi:hypothetical protein
MARHHRTHAINAHSVRGTTWARFTFNTTNAAAATYSITDLLGNYKTDGGVVVGATVTRIHLELAVTSAVAAGDTFAWGILRGQNTDVGVSVAGAPQPIADPYEDWMFWQSPHAASSLGAGPCYWHSQSNVYSLDLKAQRRLPELQMALLLVVGPQTTGAALTYAASGSVLLKLP